VTNNSREITYGHTTSLLLHKKLSVQLNRPKFVIKLSCRLTKYKKLRYRIAMGLQNLENSENFKVVGEE